MAKREPIAIVGLSTIFPGSSHAVGFWRDILAGRDMMEDIPETHWLIDDFYDPDPMAPDKVYAKRGAFLSPMPFDLIEFGIPPSSLPAIDSMQLVGLLAAREVLRDAQNGRESHVPMDRVAVYIGVAGVSEASMSAASRLQKPLWVKGMREAGIAESAVQEACDRIGKNFTPVQENTFPGLLSNVVSGRIANRFNLGGGNYTVDAACGSSLAAISAALNDLYLYNADMALCGGVDMQNNLETYVCFSKTPALSPTGDIRPFSEDSDGTMLGEGAGLFALRRLADAERDGDKIYAVITGLGASSDGRAKSVYAPRPQGQSVCMKRAYEIAEYDPHTVELVETHGTATTAGDASEFESMRIAFGDSQIGGEPTIAFGSIKSQIGHTKGAAGAASMFKAAMALHHKVLPPTIKVSKPNPKLKIEDSPFYLNTESRPWVASGRFPRRASASSFGFGGTNFHVALEEYLGTGNRPETWAYTPTELILVSADSREELATACSTLAASEQGFDEAWRKSAMQSRRQFQPKQKARLGFVAATGTEWKNKLEDAAGDLRKPGGVNRPGLYFREGETFRNEKVAFVFAGQGSQAVGMGRHLTMTFPFAQQIWDAAEPVLQEQGVSLRKLVFPPPVFDDAARTDQMRRLTSTDNLQPALAVQGMIHLELLRTLGVEPAAAIGHSFGELLALYSAGVMDCRSLLLASRKRGELMAGPECPRGAMTAVNHSEAEVTRLVEEWKTGVVLANYNSPNQTVLSGTVEAVEATEALLLTHKINFRRLPVSAAFHSPLVAPAVGPFHEFLQSIEMGSPKLDVLSNTDLACYPEDAAQIRKRLSEQLAKPVRFSDQIEDLYWRGVRVFVELGMGNTLTSLIDQTLGGREHLAVPIERKGVHGLTAMWEAIGQLAVAGVALDLAPLEAAFAPIDEPVKPKNPAATVYITGATYGKPYPPRGGTAALPKPNPEPAAVGVTPAVAAPVAVSVSVAVPAARSPARSPIAAVTESPAPAPVARSVPPLSPSASAAVLPSAAPMQRPLTPIKGVNMSQPNKNSTALSSPGRSSTLDSGSRDPSVWSEIHRQIELAQQTTQSAILETHSLTLRSLERLALGMSAAQEPSYLERPQINSTWTPPTANPDRSASVASPAVSPRPAISAVPTMTPPSAAPTPAAPTARMVAAPAGYPAVATVMAPPAAATSHASSIPQPVAVAAQPVTPAAPVAAVVLPAVAGADIAKELLEVVSEKTGYPIEVLDLETELEAGLGIDSIKRVEIFSAMQQRHPGLPEVTAEHMASLRTLRQIIDFLDHSAPVVASAATPAPLAATVVTPPARPAETVAPSAGGIKTLLLEVVAEKTGYPIEVLDLDTELEAGLGIDSIKRVEIFSAVQQQQSGLPEVTAEHMASLRTLRQIINFLETMPDPRGDVEVATAKSSDAQPVKRHEVHAVDAPASGEPMSGIAARPKIAVKDDGPEGIAAKLVEALSGKGLQVYLAVAPVSDGSALILTAGFGNRDDDGENAAEKSLTMHLEALDWMKALCAGSPAPVLITVSHCGGDFNLSGGAALGAWSGGLGAMAKTAAIEWKDASIKAIDIEGTGRDASQLAAAVVDELFYGGNVLEVGLYADGRRVMLEAVDAAALPDEVAPVMRDAVLVVSGGGRGVTSACLIELARTHQPKLVLLGRTRLVDLAAEYPGLQPSREQGPIKRYLIERAKASGASLDLSKIGQESAEIASVLDIQETLAALRLAGSEAIYLPASVTDAASVSQALAQVRNHWGPITGIIHAAGVLADKLIQDKTPEQFRSVFKTKVAGMEALLRATEHDPIRLILGFSSVAARYGNAGQCDYAAGNEVLNQLVAVEARRRGPDCLAKSLAWGPWEGGMVTPGLAAQFKARGIGMIPLEDGARQFVAELSGRRGSRQIVLGHGEEFRHLGGAKSVQAKDDPSVGVALNH